MPLYTVGLALVWFRLAINGANCLDIALDITSVNVSCSGDIASSSLTMGGTNPLPLVDLMESSVVSKIIASFSSQAASTGFAHGQTVLYFAV